jgi:hypothetical protein
VASLSTPEPWPFASSTPAARSSSRASSPRAHESAGKKTGTGNARIGNAHLKWACGEAACLLVRSSAQAKPWLARREKKHGKAKALGALAARLGRAVYHLLRKREAFDVKRFFAS